MTDRSRERAGRRRGSPLVVALYVNAALLACLLVAVLSRGGSFGSPAMAAPTEVGQPIAGGDGLYLMPAQFSTNVWGCYVMDTQRRTLTAYEYFTGQKQLQLVSSRYFAHDLELRDYNTRPSPSQVERDVRLQNEGIRGELGGDEKPLSPEGAEGRSADPPPPSAAEINEGGSRPQ